MGLCRAEGKKQKKGAAVSSPGVQGQECISKQMFPISHPQNQGRKQPGVGWEWGMGGVPEAKVKINRFAAVLSKYQAGSPVSPIPL